MLTKNLIKVCTCHNTQTFVPSKMNKVPVLKCVQCGVVHQLLEDWDTEKYFNFYKNDYHLKFQKNRGTMTYEERYDHDCKVARLRIAEYQYFIPGKSVGLDIGSSNSAFVHEVNKLGYQAKGLEPGADIGDDAVTIRGTLDTVDFDPESIDWITMHDSIEHMIDVNRALSQIYAMLKPKGKLILDLPDYFDPAGKHHWKLIEHLWFFDRGQFIYILGKAGFDVVKVTLPIPGKMVFYCEKI